MADESDGIGEAFEEHVRLAAMAGTQVAEQLVRRGAERRQARADEALREARELEDRRAAIERLGDTKARLGAEETDRSATEAVTASQEHERRDEVAVAGGHGAADPDSRASATAADGSGPDYDSAERREQTAQAMRDAGIDAELVEARMLADLAQGAPATEATAGTARAVAGNRAEGYGRGRSVDAELGR